MLHGKKGSVLPICRVERIEEIREIATHYRVSNICNMDESGSFYQMGPERGYVSGSEQIDSSSTRNVSRLFLHGIRMDPMFYQYLKSVQPTILAVSEMVGSIAKNWYWYQKNGWMDPKRFDQWINWWYSGAQFRSSGL